MNLFAKVVTISKPYLGPATEAFLTRQCKSHLSVEPADLMGLHLKELSKWVENSGALLMDAAKAKELAAKIAAM